MLAETLGETAESYTLIDQVRARTVLGDIDGSTPGTFEEKLFNERQVELAFENHRWPDLRRFGVVVEKLIEAESDVIKPSTIKNLFITPQKEIDINTNLVQNNN